MCVSVLSSHPLSRQIASVSIIHLYSKIKNVWDTERLESDTIGISKREINCAGESLLFCMRVMCASVVRDDMRNGTRGV